MNVYLCVLEVSLIDTYPTNHVVHIKMDFFCFDSFNSDLQLHLSVLKYKIFKTLLLSKMMVVLFMSNILFPSHQCDFEKCCNCSKPVHLFGIFCAG